MKSKIKTKDRLSEQINDFEKKNPDIAKAMDLLDMSMQEYGEAIRALEPSVTYTSHSTTVVNK